MHVHGTTHVHGPHGINPPHHSRLNRTDRTTGAERTGDQLQISPAAEAAIRAAETGEVRQELVAKIRSQITAGVYETPEKLDLAVDRLLDEIS